MPRTGLGIAAAHLASQLVQPVLRGGAVEEPVQKAVLLK